MSDPEHPDASEITEQLRKISTTDTFVRSSVLREILSYLVTQEIDGNGNLIKAYSIGVDAMGRPSDFDPQTDPSVRNNMRRLRNALEIYYSSTGKDDLVIIEIPKGQYRPKFTRPPQVEGTPRSQFSFSRNNLGLIGLVGVVLVAIALFYSATRQSDSVDAFAERPIVEIGLFASEGAPDDARYLDGLRAKLGEDLSRFGTLLIRLTPADESARKRKRRPADYMVTAQLAHLNSEEQLSILVTRESNGTILWSETTTVPVSSGEKSAHYEQQLNELARVLGDHSGLISADRLQQFESNVGLKSLGSNFDCVLLFHSYDLTKDPERERGARDCLTAEIESGSLSSQVWAAWSLMRMLDWTRGGGTEDLDEAMRAANRAISLDSTNASAHEYRGSVFLAKGQHDQARQSFQRALSLNPSKSDHYILLGWEEVVAGNWESGSALIRQGISMSPAPSGWMYIPLSIDAFRQGDCETAGELADLIISNGDSRGLVLALAAAIDCKNSSKTDSLTAKLAAIGVDDPVVAIDEIERVFNNQTVIALYRDTFGGGSPQ